MYLSYMSVSHCVPKNDLFPISLLSTLYQDNTLSLTNVVTYPHCFLTAYKSLWRLPVLAGTSDSKNPDLCCLHRNLKKYKLHSLPKNDKYKFKYLKLKIDCFTMWHLWTKFISMQICQAQFSKFNEWSTKFVSNCFIEFIRMECHILYRGYFKASTFTDTVFKFLQAKRH